MVLILRRGLYRRAAYGRCKRDYECIKGTLHGNTLRYEKTARQAEKLFEGCDLDIEPANGMAAAPENHQKLHEGLKAAVPALMHAQILHRFYGDHGLHLPAPG